MDTKAKGFTMIELMIVLAMIALIGGAVWVAVANHSRGHEAATETAQEYAAELGIPVKAISCAQIDSDGDGYIGCTIMPATSDARPIMVECTGAWTWNHGCRAPKASISVRGE